MESALDEIGSLALSQNRVDALRYFAERPHSRRGLIERTRASQSMMERILSDFEDRSWLVREDGAYRTTVMGELVSRGFDSLVDILDTDAKLRPVVEWLPTDAVTFGLEYLTEATIIAPSRIRPNAPVKRTVFLLSEAEDVHIFSYAFNRQNPDIIRERITAGNQRFRGVFSSDTIDALAHDSQLRKQLRDLLDVDAAAVHITDEPIPMVATIADSTVHLFLHDDSDIPQVSIGMTKPEVLTQTDELLERYWEAARPLDLNQF